MPLFVGKMHQVMSCLVYLVVDLAASCIWPDLHIGPDWKCTNGWTEQGQSQCCFSCCNAVHGPQVTWRGKKNCTRCACSISCVKACCKPTCIFCRILFEHSTPPKWKSQKISLLPGWIPSLVMFGNDLRLLNGGKKLPLIHAVLHCSHCSMGTRLVKGEARWWTCLVSSPFSIPGLNAHH